jgi:hypothetical protein
MPDITNSAAVTGECDIFSVSQNVASGTVLGVGNHTITLTANDGFATATCTTYVTVRDTVAPTFAACAPFTSMSSLCHQLLTRF